MGILDTLLTGIGAKAMPKANRIAYQALAVVKGNTPATREPDPPDHESCDSAYLHTLFYDLEAAANMRTNCPSSRSPIGRTPMEVVVQRGILVNRFIEASRATSKNQAQVDRSARAALANPHIIYKLLTSEVATVLGSTVDSIDTQNQNNSEAAFEIFNRVLRDTSFRIDWTPPDMLGSTLFRTLHPTNPDIRTDQAIELAKHYVVDNNSGDSLPNLSQLETMFNDPYFRPQMINPSQYNYDKPWKTIASDYFNASGLIQSGLIPQESLRSYDAGFALAVASGNDEITPEIALNYAYALGAIGPDRTQALHRQTNLTYFARYSPGLLAEFNDNLQPENNSWKSPFFVSFPLSDHNGFFYRAGHALDPLTSHYRLYPSESGDEGHLYYNIDKAAQIRGPLSGAVLAGHGTGNSVQMGRQVIQTGRKSPYIRPELIDTSDRLPWMNMRPYFVDDPVIAFLACSTGEREKNGIEGMFSELWPNGRIFAPTEDIRFGYPILSRNGTIQSFEYDVPTREMIGRQTIGISSP